MAKSDRREDSKSQRNILLKAAIYNRNCKVLLFCYVIYAGSAMIFGPKMRLISLLTVFVVVGAEEEEIKRNPEDGKVQFSQDEVLFNHF